MASAGRGVREFTLEVTCDRSTVKQIVRVVLHAILFQRYLGPVSPRRLEICDLTFIAPQDSDIAAEVEQHADVFARLLDQPSVRSRKLSLSFYEHARPPKAVKAPTSWFPYAAISPEREREREEKPFEVWTIEVTVAPATTERERSRLASITRAQLANFQVSLLRFANDHRAHIPPITREGNPFPYEIEVNTGAGRRGDEGWLPGGLRRMLSEP